MWLGLSKVVPVGAVVSITNGPRWTVLVQWPTSSAVRRWSHQEPSASGALVDCSPAVSIRSSGTEAALCVHSSEYPATPLPSSQASTQETSTVLSRDALFGSCESLHTSGSSGGAVSIRKGPACAAPWAGLAPVSTERTWNHHSPSSSSSAACVPVTSITSSGTVSGSSDQAVE